RWHQPYPTPWHPPTPPTTTPPTTTTGSTTATTGSKQAPTRRPPSPTPARWPRHPARSGLPTRPPEPTPATLPRPAAVPNAAAGGGGPGTGKPRHRVLWQNPRGEPRKDRHPSPPNGPRYPNATGLTPHGEVTNRWIPTTTRRPVCVLETIA